MVAMRAGARSPSGARTPRLEDEHIGGAHPFDMHRLEVCHATPLGVVEGEVRDLAAAEAEGTLPALVAVGAAWLLEGAPEVGDVGVDWTGLGSRPGGYIQPHERHERWGWTTRVGGRAEQVGEGARAEGAEGACGAGG